MKTQVWAHRGASAYAPENTLEAFELAVRQGADGIELDVQMTKDRKLVVAHDETIDRTSEGTGRIVDYTLAELKQFHFNRTHASYREARIPELREVYDLLRLTDLTINVEIKTGIVLYAGIEALVLAETARMGMMERVIFSSFYHRSLQLVKSLDRSAKTGILYSEGWVDVIPYAKRLGASAIHPLWYHLQDDELTGAARAVDLGVHAWTINRRGDMEWAVSRGADAIITDCPDVCRKVIDHLGS